VFELNFLPRAMRESSKKRKNISFDFHMQDISPVPVIAGIVAIIVLIQLTLGVFSFVQKKRISSLSKALTDIAAQRAIAVTLKKEVDKLSGRFAVIEGLTQGSLEWSKKLYDLSNSMVEGIWLNSLSLASEAVKAPAQLPRGKSAKPAIPRQTLVVKGLAVSTGTGEEAATVGVFMESLKNNRDFFKDFDDIKLSSVQRQFYGKAEVMSFTVICYFKTDRSYFERFEGSDY